MSHARPPPERFKLALYGGGSEELDRFGVRDRIRKGEVDGTTPLARPGTDAWCAASEYPELKRYLELAATARPAAPAGPAPPKPTATMLVRASKGIAYPFSVAGIMTMLVVLFLSFLPFLFSLLSLAMTSVYVLNIVRTSANGETEFPGWSDADDIFGTVVLWLKTIAVSAIALFPVVVWATYWYTTTSGRLQPDALVRLGVGAAIALLVSSLYYPACLATMAVWDSVLDSLNPAYVLRVITTIGGDYFFCVAIWAVATAGAVGAALVLNLLIGDIPIVGHLPGKIAGLWAQFYTAHLLGWAVHRHAVELGWD